MGITPPTPLHPNTGTAFPNGIEFKVVKRQEEEEG
jgi:hypothetical protein